MSSDIESDPRDNITTNKGHPNTTSSFISDRLSRSGMTGTKSPRENTPVGRGHLSPSVAILNYGGGRGFALALARGAIRDTSLIQDLILLLLRVADFDLSLDGSNPTTGWFNDMDALFRKMAPDCIFISETF